MTVRGETGTYPEATWDRKGLIGHTVTIEQLPERTARLVGLHHIPGQLAAVERINGHIEAVPSTATPDRITSLEELASQWARGVNAVFLRKS